MKRLILVMLCGIICLETGMTAYAQERKEPYDYEVESELSMEVLEAAVKETMKETNGDDVAEGNLGTGNEFGIKEYDLEDAYIEYTTCLQPISTYMDTKSFDAVMSGEKKVIVPYVTNDNKDAVLSYRIEDGTLELISKAILGDSNDRYIPIEEINAIVADELSNKSIKNIRYVYAELYSTTLIYVETDKGEYVIPYAREGVLNVKNGKTYTVEKLFKKLNMLFDDKHLKETDSVGGLPYRQQNFGLYFCIMLGSLVAMVICIVCIRKRRNSR